MATMVPSLHYATAMHTGGVWRQGKYLVMHKSATLPDLCVKSGEPAHGYKLKRSLSWHHPIIYLLILPGLLFYAIVALILRKTATIHIGLSERYRRKRRNAILFGWLSCLGSIVLAIYFFNSNSPELGILGILAFLVCLVVAIIRSRIVTPLKIDKEYVWLRGVHASYLDRLPPLS